MDLSIIIVNYKTKDRLKNNLAVLLSSRTRYSFEIIAIDNDSQDGSLEMLKTDFPQVKLIANRANIGFAKAVNQGLKILQGRYLLLLNPDMKPHSDTLENLIGWLDRHQQAAIAGIKLVDRDGNVVPHIRRFPRLFDQMMIASKLAHLFPFSLSKYLMKNFDYSSEAKVDSMRGSFMVIRRETYEKLGGLDERYFLWFDEVDYCRQARAAGLEVWYTPIAECVDLVGQSFNQVSGRAKQKIFKDSMLKYFAKWHSFPAVWLLRAAWAKGAFMWWLAAGLKIKPRTKT